LIWNKRSALETLVSLTINGNNLDWSKLQGLSMAALAKVIGSASERQQAARLLNYKLTNTPRSPNSATPSIRAAGHCFASITHEQHGEQKTHARDCQNGPRRQPRRMSDKDSHRSLRIQDASQESKWPHRGDA
jgi:hypothetical protein